MLKTLLLMKLINLKRKKQKAGIKQKVRSESAQSTIKNVYIKCEEDVHHVHDECKTCRVCLKDGSIPIYGDENFADISEDLSTFGSIVVRFDDIHPKYLCESCHALLQGAVSFRRTAQQSDKFLRQPTPINNLSVEDEDISTDLDNNECENDTNNLDFEYKIEAVKFEGKNTEEKQPDVYYCKRCNLDFETKEEFSNHRLSEEHENKKTICPICNNSYNHQYIKKHLALHKKETPYMCDICGKKFIIKGQFTRHRITHSYNLPFQCSLCPYKGRFRESLKMHMRSHTGEKPYHCPQCPTRFFVNKSNLSRHLLTHKGDRDFKCDQCQRGFYTQRELDVHFKVDHGGMKDFICNACGKTFGYRKQLMKHQLKVHKRGKLRCGRTPLYLLVEKQQDHETFNE